MSMASVPRQPGRRTKPCFQSDPVLREIISLTAARISILMMHHLEMIESNMTNPNHMLQTDAMNIIYESMSNLGEKINFLDEGEDKTRTVARMDQR